MPVDAVCFLKRTRIFAYVFDQDDFATCVNVEGP